MDQTSYQVKANAFAGSAISKLKVTVASPSCVEEKATELKTALNAREHSPVELSAPLTLKYNAPPAALDVIPNALVEDASYIGVPPAEPVTSKTLDTFLSAPVLPNPVITVVFLVRLADQLLR
tara:strand:- start:561 stop:929 length:369 start_codon:yes stop_codon:yes gene_type:complete